MNAAFTPNAITVEQGDAGSASRRVVYVLHGILGSANNWRSFCRSLVGVRPDLKLVLVDLRNHGRSGAAPGPQTLVACAEDLTALHPTMGVPSAVIGHSFGGKVALAYAGRRDVHLEQVWVIDAPPGVVQNDSAQGEIGRVFAALDAIQLPINGRNELIEHFAEHSIGPAIARWMATNLVRAPGGGFTWRFHLGNIEQMIADYLRSDLWSVVDELAPATTQLVIGGRSDRWTPEAQAELDARRPEQVGRHVIAEAGHWVHAEAPGALRNLLVADLL